MNKKKINLSIEVLIFMTFLFLAVTGLVFRFAPAERQVEQPWLILHYWIGMLMLGSIAVHLVLHWQWIKAVATRFFKKTSRQARINFCLDTLMFGVFFLINLSGLIQWITASRQGLFYVMHRNTGVALVIYVMLHLSLHWKWIANMLGNSFKHFAQRWSRQPITS